MSIPKIIHQTWKTKEIPKIDSIYEATNDSINISREKYKFHIISIEEFNKQLNKLYEFRQQKFKRGDTISKFLACSRLSVMIINNYLYCHAGFIESIVAELKTFNEVHEVHKDHEDKKVKSDPTIILSTFNNIIKLWLLNSKTYDKYTKKEVGDTDNDLDISIITALENG